MIDFNKIPKIRVCLRKRPIFKKEILNKEKDIVEIKLPQEVLVKEIKLKLDLTKYIESHYFKFDNVFNEKQSNYDIYK